MGCKGLGSLQKRAMATIDLRESNRLDGLRNELNGGDSLGYSKSLGSLRNKSNGGD